MSFDLKFEDKELEKAVKWYSVTAPKRMIPKVFQGYINDIAFGVKKASKVTMDKSFDYKSSRTRKYIESAVFVKKARPSTNISKIEAEVGVLSGSTSTRKTYKREIAARQETGGALKQVKSRGSGFRGQLMVPSAKVAPKKNIKFRKAGLVRSRKDIVNKKQRMAAALKTARSKNKKYASTPYGIYKVLKRKAHIVRIFKKSGTVNTPKNPWLKPATPIAMKNYKRVFQKNLNRQLKKFKMK